MKFRLAGLLRVRALQEDLAAAELADARRELRSVRARRARTIAALEGVDAAQVGIANLSAIAASRASADALIADLRILEESLGIRIDQAAEDHRTTHTATRTVERLRDRFDAARRRDRQRHEQIEMDEIAGNRWNDGRRQAEEAGS